MTISTDEHRTTDRAPGAGHAGEQDVAPLPARRQAAGRPAEQERRVPCLVANAGRPLTTGRQAQCYADHFIGAT